MSIHVERQDSDASLNEPDRISEYAAKLVAEAPPISAATRAKLSALLGSSAPVRGAA